MLSNVEVGNIFNLNIILIIMSQKHDIHVILFGGGGLREMWQARGFDFVADLAAAEK